MRKEEKKMKTGDTAKKGLYIGAGAGLAAFAVLGLLPGSFIGGLIGLNIAGSLLGRPVEASLLPRMIISASMVLGVILSGTVFVTSASLLGRAAGVMVDTVRYGRVARQQTSVEVVRNK